MENKKTSGGFTQTSVDLLVPYERNARTHSEEQVEKIAKSIEEFGFVNPVIINKDNMIIAGHGRVLAAKKMGLLTVPTVCVDYLSEEQVRAYILADNRLAEDAGWDEEILMSELNDLDGAGFDISVTGFSLDEEFNDQLESLKTVTEDTDEIAIPNEPKSKPGEIYKLGNHILMCGDSTDINDVEKLTCGAEINLVVTDPPYNVNYQSQAGNIKNDNMEDAKFREFLTSAFYNIYHSLAPGGAFYIWHADSEGFNFRAAAKDAGLIIHECLVWVKDALVLGRQDYQWKHEPCLYGWKEGAAHFWAGGRKERTSITDFDIFELRDYSQTELLKFIEERLCDKENNETSVIYEERPKVSDEHPTMKPVRLIARQIRNSSKEGDLVMDLFGGSGTTLIACEQMNRKCFMMEYDPKYVDVIINRWEHFTGRKAELL